jgi:hypothetical protein
MSSLSRSHQVIYFPGYGPNCEENDGFGAEVFLISKTEWKRTQQKMLWYGTDRSKPPQSRKSYASFDYSCGAHGCLIDFDMLEAFETLQVVEDKPTKEVISVIQKMESKKFWEALQKWLGDDLLEESDEKNVKKVPKWEKM